MSQNGISTILLHLGTASCALESSRVGIAEVKTAEASAKLAADLLKATRVFLENEIYQVCDEPRCSPYVDPANHKIEMPEVRTSEPPAEPAAELPPLPDLLGEFPQFHAAAQAAVFEKGLEALWSKAPEQDLGDAIPGAWADPWRAAFGDARLDTYARLVYALEHRQPASLAFPGDEEMATWRARFAAPLPPLPDELVQFDTWDEGDATDEFSRRLEDLGEGASEEVDFDAWTQAWDQDRKDTFVRLLAAEAKGSAALPSDTERDAWLAQFAPAPAPQEEPAGEVETAALDEDARRAQLFEDKLAELEEVGVRESALKRKGWKKAEKAWHLEFAGDAAKAMDKLLWRLGRAVVVWDVPSDEEVNPAPAAEKASA